MEKRMNEYNMFQAIYMSFYSKKLYRDVAVNWGGRAFLYLFLLLVIFWIPLTYKMQKMFNRLYAKDVTSVLQQFPALTIKEGKLSTPESKPYFIENPETKKTMIVIDTSGRYVKPEQAKTAWLITQTEIIKQVNPNEFNIEKIPNVSLTLIPENVDRILKEFLNFIWLPALIFFPIISFAYRLVQALIYSVIGKIFAKICKIPLSYGQILQIALVAITPVIVVDTLLFFIIKPPLYQPLFFILAILYLFFGIFANKETVARKG